MNITNEHLIAETQAPEKQLEKAFELFNQFSEQLASSYSDLESQVTRLTKELNEARSERLIQLAEKEVLATRLEGLLDALPAGIVVLDEKNRITQTNPVARFMLAAKKEDNNLLGQKWSQVAQKSIQTEANELRLHDGRWINLSVCPLNTCNMDTNNVAINSGKIILISDITENRSLQMKLNHQQRLSSLGEMVASLAHQIRTPLASALLYISTINHPVNTEKDRIRFADKTKERLHHLERMVNDMLIFARGDVSESEYINADELMLHLKNMVAGNDSSERFVFGINQNLQNVKIKANRDVLQSALQNIIDNAIEARTTMDTTMEEATTKNPAKALITINAFLNTDNQFEISIKDNGCGMSEAVKDKVLEPFFTTKSSGTGLGLAVVHATVNRYGGEIKLSSEEGVGSDFTVTLPCAAASGMLPSNLSLLRSNAGKTNKNKVNYFLSEKNIINIQFKDINKQEVAL